MNKKILNSLFTGESLLSLQGAATVVVIVPNVLTFLIGTTFQPYEKWVAFAIAMCLSLMVASQASEKSVTKWALAILNGFFIFASAVGLTEAIGATATPGAGTDMTSTEATGGLPFFHSWYP